MKKILRLIMPAALTATLLVNSIPESVQAAPDKQSTLSVLTRVYDTTNDGVRHYHYEDESGKTIRLQKDAALKASSKRSLKKAENLPTSYDLRDKNAVTPIKNQGITGACWAFGAIKALESNLIMQGMGTSETTDLSESHLTWYSYYASTIANAPLAGEGISFLHYELEDTQSKNSAAYYIGGDALMAAFTLARGSGAVNESVAPFPGANIASVNSMADSLASTNNSLYYQRDYTLKAASCYDGTTRDDIKKAIMENGAVDVAFFYSYDYLSSNEQAYYQNKITNDTLEAAGETASEVANHCVTIVGWDDNYSKENFDACKPSSDGAWLIANTWGTDVGDNGYMWISYEDATLSDFYSFKGTEKSVYDNNYQYDAIGWGNAININEDSSTTVANIFTANSEYNQSLDSIGIYTLEPNQPYTASIYTGVSDDNPTSGTLVTTISDTQPYSGYHMISLDKSVSLTAGEKFSVVITYDKTETANGYVPIEGDSYDDYYTLTTYTSHNKESFLYIDGSWKDLRTYHNEHFNNVCLKAFTTNVSKATENTNTGNTSDTTNTNTGNSTDNANTNNTITNNNGGSSTTNTTNTSLSFSRTKLTLGAKESYKLSTILKKTGSANVSYQSSNSSIVKVAANGKITAKKKGNATITASVGDKKATIKVVVKKAPSKITLKPSKKKVLKKGSSCTLKVTLSKGSASQTIRYSSSKAKVASVSSDGKITAKKKGSTTITVKTYNNKKASIKILVR